MEEEQKILCAILPPIKRSPCRNPQSPPDFEPKRYAHAALLYGKSLQAREAAKRAYSESSGHQEKPLNSNYLRNLLQLTGVTYDGFGMAFQALLFCPDDKTARTVTQVLSELEFTVEACTEPFAAVKKLMSQHFDAIVVDCDNEQNATLLFKSARNSTSNQASLAVAIVEGQAGVAKAFRIGANLVLTTPLNIEQAKGTLRVARGLLRKSDPTKPGSATATGSFAVPTPPPAAPTPAPAPTKSAAPRPPLGAKPAAPGAPKPAVSTATTASRPQPPVQKPVAPAPPAAWPAAAAAAKPAPVAENDIPAAPAPEKPPPPIARHALYMHA